MGKSNRDDLILKFLKEKPFSMLKEPVGYLNYKFVDPGADYIGNLWDWDSYFTINGLFQICEFFKDDKEFNYKEKFSRTIEHAKGCVNIFLDLQKDDGFIPMACANDGRYAKDLFEAHDKKETVNQHKPFLCQNILNISEHINDYFWFDVKKVVKYIDYYFENQFDKESGLFFWQNDVMIGIDNNPTVFGRPDKSSADIYLNCFMFSELSALCCILRKLGDKRYFLFLERKENLKKSINELMYDERDEIYYSVDLLSKTRERGIFHKNLGVFWKALPLKIRFWACFLPMTLGISSQNINKKMIKKHFYDKNFLSEFGIRSVSKDEKMFDERPSGNPSNWLGSVWIISNYLIWKGLKENGFKKEAKILKEKILNLVYIDIKENGQMSESYNSFTGKPVLNGGFISWNCLIIEMIK